MSVPWIALVSGLLISQTTIGFAVEINGTVRSATDKYATVASDSDLMPMPGDKAEIFFKLPGANDEISVAAGHVYEVTGPNIMLEIKEASGSVAKDQLVRINSPNPQKKTTANVTAGSPSQATSPIAAATLPQQIDPAAAEFVNKGVAQYSAGDFNGAIDSYTSGIRIAPNLAKLYLNRANAYLCQPNFESAIADADKALELKVEKADDAYVIRGAARAGLGNYGAGIADCNRALKINPNHTLAYNNRANNKLRLRDLNGALADCNKSIALDPNSALPYYNRGYVYMNKGNRNKAIADWKKAMQLQPGFRAELEPLVQKFAPD